MDVESYFRFVEVDRVGVIITVVKKINMIIPMFQPKSAIELHRRLELSRPSIWLLPLIKQ